MANKVLKYEMDQGLIVNLVKKYIENSTVKLALENETRSINKEREYLRQ